MFSSIQTIISQGSFSGCSITLRQGKEDQLQAILAFLLPASADPALFKNHEKDDVNRRLDEVLALRSALVSPLVVTASPSALHEAIDNELTNLSENMIAGAKVLNGIDISSVIQQSTSKVAANQSKQETKTADAKSTPAESQKAPKTAVAASPAKNVEPEPTGNDELFPDFDSL